MKKQFKKIVAIVLTLAMAMSIGLPAFASETSVNGNLNETTTITSEYEMIKYLRTMPLTVSSNGEGYTAEDIDMILHYEDYFAEHVAELNELSDQQLYNLGYEAEQVDVIRNYTGSEAEIALASATVSLNTWTTGFAYDGDYTRGTLNYSWGWSGLPAIKKTDVVAAAWNDWVVTDEYSRVSYYVVGTDEYFDDMEATYVPQNGNIQGAGHTFELIENDEGVVQYKALSGAGSFTVKSDVHAEKDFHYRVEYGHSTLTATPSFSVSFMSVPGSIEFSMGVTVEAEEYGAAEL